MSPTVPQTLYSFPIRLASTDFFLKNFFFICQTWRIASLPLRRHLISCVPLVIVLSKYIYIHHKLLIVIKNVFELPCMLDMYGLFYLFSPFMCLKMSFFCRMTPAWHSHFIYELTFLELQQKSDRTPPHTPPPLSLSLSSVQVRFSCVQVRRRRSPLRRSKRAACAFLMEVDLRGILVRGGGREDREKKTDLTV